MLVMICVLECLKSTRQGGTKRYNLPAAAPPPPPLTVNQPMRLRDISQQMDRDAIRAIQSALDRYRLQEEELTRQQNSTREDADRLDFELVHIPLAIDEDGLHRLSLFQFDRDQNQDKNKE